MSTRAQVRFATREPGISFSEHPDSHGGKIHAQFYVHSDGYPEGLGVEIAESITGNGKINGWEIEHVQDAHGDLEYIYYVWSDYDKSTWISIFEVIDYLRNDGSTYPLSRECVFVGKPEALLKKYKLNTNADG
jgi:hypothetical protein